jgi:hypothetical protein
MTDNGATIHRGGYRRQLRLYLTLDALAEMAGVDPSLLSVTLVDKAPDRDDQAVRVCLLEMEAE